MSNTRTCMHIKVSAVRRGSPLSGEQYGYVHKRMRRTTRVSRVVLLEENEAIQVSSPQTVDSFCAAPSMSNAASRFSARTIPSLTLLSLNPKMAHLKIWGSKVEAAPLHT